jgi:hypothetical protein
MENWKLAMYVREVGNQADIFRVAAQDFNTPHMALNPTTNKDDDNWVRLYSALQTMLSAAAVLSKLLWVQQVTVDHQGRELDAEKLRLRDIGLQ